MIVENVLNNILKGKRKMEDYKFYNITEYSDNCEDETYLIYSDNSYNYYLNCANSDGVLITFVTCNKKMNIEYAMDNNYIDIKVLARDYPDLITRERKQFYMHQYIETIF